MKLVEQIMGMPVTIEVRDKNVTTSNFKEVFDYFRYVDERYSPFKKNSEVSKYNRGEKVTSEMKRILELCRQTSKETDGYFDIRKDDGKIDPSGLVKGWAVYNASKILIKNKFKNFYVDAGGDAQIVGKFKWGIRNPFNVKEIVKVYDLENCGIATSGTYERGNHIWNPIDNKKKLVEIVSVTIIADNVYEADRFATAIFAMGKDGLKFLGGKKNLKGYIIDNKGMSYEIN